MRRRAVRERSVSRVPGPGHAGARDAPRAATGTVTITALSRATAVPSSALRYYESIGLLAPARRTPAGYRLYDHEAEGRVRFIRLAQASGLTLDDVRALLDPRGSAAACAAVRDIMRRRLTEIEARIAELRRLGTVLRRGLACRSGKPTDLCRTLCRAAGAACDRSCAAPPDVGGCR
jgi:DNA-binding transcriptional MerR regulator